MNTFKDEEHTIPEIVIQLVDETDPKEWCDQETLDALKSWNERPIASDPHLSILRLSNTLGFTISYEGESSNYWPDEKSNLIVESLVRDILYADGICSIQDYNSRLYRVSFRVTGMADSESILVCPYPTQEGNISGLVVICVNNRLVRRD